MERLHFNTVVSSLMEFANILGDRYRTGAWRTSTFQEAIETLDVLLAPVAPFIAEGLWQVTGGFGRSTSGSPLAGSADVPFGKADSVHRQAWPTWEERLTRAEHATIVVQVNGKLRDKLEIPVDADEAEIRAAALARPKVREVVPIPESARFVYVPGRLLNVVTTGQLGARER
jgi:leucyl-tRNA synthetase